MLLIYGRYMEVDGDYGLSSGDDDEQNFEQIPQFNFGNEEVEPRNYESVTITETDSFTIRCIYGLEKSFNLQTNEANTVYEWSELVEITEEFVKMVGEKPALTKCDSHMEHAWNKWIEKRDEKLLYYSSLMPIYARFWHLVNHSNGLFKVILSFHESYGFEDGEIMFLIEEKIRVKKLKELAAAVVTEQLDDDEDIDKLEMYIPTSLCQYLKNNFSDYYKNWMEGGVSDNSSELVLDNSMDEALSQDSINMMNL